MAYNPYTGTAGTPVAPQVAGASVQGVRRPSGGVPAKGPTRRRGVQPPPRAQARQQGGGMPSIAPGQLPVTSVPPIQTPQTSMMPDYQVGAPEVGDIGAAAAMGRVPGIGQPGTMNAPKRRNGGPAWR